MIKRIKNEAVTKIKKHTRDWGYGYKRRLSTEFQRLWRTKSGGFYGIGYIISFVFLELRSFAEELINFDFTISGLIGQLISQILSFGVETLINSIQSFAWPWFFIKYFHWLPGAVLLVLGFFLHTWIVKKWDLTKVFGLKNSIIQQDVDSVLDICFVKDNQKQTIALTDDFDEYLKSKGNLNLSASQTEKLHQQLNLSIDFQLDDWRQHPDSCLALLLLVSHLSTTISDDSKKYCGQIIDEAIRLEVDEELNWLERCIFYLPLLKSSNPKQVKKMQKKISKWTAKLKRAQGKKVNQFIQDFLE